MKNKLIKKTFILGFTYGKDGNISSMLDDIDGANLTEFKTMKEAHENCEEWCTVEANSIKEARLNYENSFNEHKAKGRIVASWH